MRKGRRLYQHCSLIDGTDNIASKLQFDCGESKIPGKNLAQATTLVRSIDTWASDFGNNKDPRLKRC